MLTLRCWFCQGDGFCCAGCGCRMMACCACPPATAIVACCNCSDLPSSLVPDEPEPGPARQGLFDGAPVPANVVVHQRRAEHRATKHVIGVKV